MREFARCAAKRHPLEAADFVLRKTPSWTAAGVKIWSRLTDPHCVPAEASRKDARALLLRKEEPYLRPALAEALVRETLPTFDERRINTAQPLDYGTLADRLWSAKGCEYCAHAKPKEVEKAKALSSVALRPLIFAECVTRTDPESVHKMLIADASSPEESAAVQALRPAFEHCVVQGDVFEASVTEVRMNLALTYYRLANAPRVQTKQ